MERFYGTTDFQISTATAIAIGKFDGVHLGHQKLLQEIVEQKKYGLKACVFTFDPSPASFFGFSDGKELCTPEEKRKLLEQAGVDILIEYPLNENTAGVAPEAFVRDILVGKLQVAYLAAGEDLSFGKGGKGNWQLLEKLQSEYGYELKRIEKVSKGGQIVSSTRIRDLVEKGCVEEAADLLGRPYSFEGEVVMGNQIGRTLGFPTVNLEIGTTKLLPPFGVYATTVSWNGHCYEAISNIGEKPTVSEERKPGIESYLYDFDRNLYGEKVKVELLHFRRSERRFSGLEEFKAQLERDKERH